MAGIDDKNEVQWGHCASWTERADLKIKCRDLISEQKKLDLSKLLDDVQPLIQTDWERRKFKEFKSLTVDPPFWAVMTTYFVTLICNIGIIIGFSFMKDSYAQKRMNFSRSRKN